MEANAPDARYRGATIFEKTIGRQYNAVSGFSAAALGHAPDNL